MPTPGATASQLGPGAKLADVATEPIGYMARAALLLVTEPPERVSGRVTHSQPLLTEFGWLDRAEGAGVERRGSAFAES